MRLPRKRFDELAVGLDDEEAIVLAAKSDQELKSGAVAPISHEEMMRRLRQ